MHRLPGVPRYAPDRLNGDLTKALTDGLYDLLLTEGLARSIDALDPGSTGVAALKGSAAQLLVDALVRQLGAILEDLGGDDTDTPKRQLERVNDLLVTLRRRLAAADGSGATAPAAEVIDLVADPVRVLRAVRRDQQFTAAPEIGLAAPWLFTAGKGSPSLLQEIHRELPSADQVDIQVSFITVSGVRKLQDVLPQITATGAQGQSTTRLRILTTTPPTPSIGKRWPPPLATSPSVASPTGRSASSTCSPRPVRTASVRWKMRPPSHASRVLSVGRVGVRSAEQRQARQTR